MADDAPDINSLWTKALEAGSPKMFRGIVGCTFFTYGLNWIPEIPTNDLDLILQYGFFGGSSLSALYVLIGVVSGK